jgi:hypothetical protein
MNKRFLSRFIDFVFDWTGGIVSLIDYALYVASFTLINTSLFEKIRWKLAQLEIFLREKLNCKRIRQ